MIGLKLIHWYKLNKRNLPWRETLNPYHIWVSEIILQQTRVNQGLGYYYRFMERFPDIFVLAEAPIDDVLKVWQGLGYYSRARNMHVAANAIVSGYQGKFPQTHRELITIKGIGDYTASAIASFSFGEAVPVIDGNVNRVIARLYGISHPIDKSEGKKQIRKYAEDMMVRSSPGMYNQAVMEFGALQCVPHHPDCETCVLKTVCVGYAEELVSVLPVKSKSMNIKTRYFHYLVVNYHDDTYLQRRSEKDIWNGLYEFPMIETDTPIELEALEHSKLWRSWFYGQVPTIRASTTEIIHRLTHRILKIRFYEIYIDQPMHIQNQIQVVWSDIHQYAIPKVIDNYLTSRSEK